MKVFDIISESKDLNEGLSRWIAFAKLFGHGAKKEAAELLGKKWSKELYFDDAITSSPTDILKGVHAKYANDPKVIEAAKVYAKEAAAKAGWAAKKTVAAQIYRTGADGMIFLGNLGATGALLVPPAKQYFAQMEIAEKKLADGEITEEQFAAIRQHQMSILTGRIAAAIATASFMKGFFGPAIATLRGLAKLNKSIAGPSSIIADALSGVKIAGNVYVANLLSSGALADAIAEVMSIGIVQETAGARAVEIADWAKAKLGQTQPSDSVGKGDAVQPSSIAQAAITATSQEPAAPKGDPNAQVTSINQIKDPKTGQIRIKRPDEY